MLEHGWYQIAFDRDLTQEVMPLRLFGRSLVGVRPTGEPLRIFSATCPHRGADLARGGRLVGSTLRCPFHGLRIGLGTCSDDGLSVREYPTLVAGGLVFVRLSDREQPDLAPALHELAESHEIVPGFELEVGTSLEVVSENGWDPAHFRAVHGLPFTPRFRTWEEGGTLVSEGDFTIRRSGWFEPASGKSVLSTTFLARAYSPGLVIAQLRGSPPYNYTVITGSISHESLDRCTVRVSLAVPRSSEVDALGAGREAFIASLLTMSRRGLEEDRALWEYLDLDAASQLLPGDDLFLEFARFCRSFGRTRDQRLAHCD